MNQKILLKTVATMMIVCMVFANFATIGKYVYAANDNIENQSTLTNNASVNFDAYFKDENGNKKHTIKANINEEITMYLYGKVAEGYLKDIQVNLNNVNFEIIEDKITYGDIENVSGNTISLNRIRRDEELEVAIPLKAIKTSEISLDMFNKENEVSMNALLVKNNSKTKKVNKTINTIVEWYGIAEAEINQEVSKFVVIDDEKSSEVILQTVINTNLKEDVLPIESTEIEVNVPEINGIYPEKIYVNSNDELNFNETNWSKIDNKINIKVENKANENKVKWNRNEKDEFTLTYIYNKDAYKEVNKINLDAKVIIKAYNNEETIATAESSVQKELLEKIGDAVETKLIRENINKGYMYTGYETEYKENLSLDIASIDLEKTIIINEEKDVFIGENDLQTEVKSLYKNTKINKLNFEKILGNNGYIKIYNDNELIATIDNNMDLDDNDNYVVTYKSNINAIKLEISEPKTVGKLILENNKVIPVQEEKSEITDYKKISTMIDEKTYNTDLEEPTTQVETSISNKKLSTLVENENVEFRVVLKNSDVSESLYENPIVKIKLPEYIDKISFNDITKILFTDELNVKETQYNEDEKVITVILDGKQTKYNDITVTEGTTLIIDMNIKLKDKTPAMKDNIVTTVENKEEKVLSETVINYIIPNKFEEEVVEGKEDINQEVQNTEQPEVQEPIKEENNNENIQIPNTELNAGQPEVEIEKPESELQVLLQSNLENNAQVKEGQVIDYTATVVNMGKTKLENVILTVNIPNGASYREFVKGGNYSYDEYVTYNTTECAKTIKSINPGEKATLDFQIIVNEKTENVEKLVLQAIARADGYKDAVSEKIESEITTGMLNIDLITKYSFDEKYLPGEEITYIAYVQNIKSIDATNVKVSAKLPDGVSFKNAYFAVKMDNDGKQIEYNKDTNTVIWTIDKMEANSRTEVGLIGEVADNISKIQNKFEAVCDGITTVYSNEVTRYVDKANLTISQDTNIQDTFIDVGDVLKYYITIKNEGTQTAEDVSIIDTLPDGLEQVTLKYKVGNTESEELNTQNKTITLSGFEIEAGGTLSVTITAKVSELSKDAKGTIILTNTVSTSAKNISEIKANEVTHKIKVKSQENTNIENNENKKYSITGKAWLDTSRNGQYDENEQVLKDIEVRLITKDERVIAKTKTNKKGEYSFDNLDNGEYLVIYIYDSSKYEITTYQASGVVESKNSDAAIEKDDFIDGNITKFAVTDVITINNSNLYNIDLGLYEKLTFDLSLTKTISKVTVNNSSTMKSYSYKNKTLAKVEIPSKEINNTTVVIEYTMTVKNEGNLAGYAKSIVDYLPNDLKFSSELNKDWYVGKNGNLYNNSLANTIIEPGETKEVKLIVTKAMNENNLGTTNNSAEIAESYNNYGVEDIDSIAGNKSSKEDDYGTADMLVSLNTGTIVMYTGLGITMLAIIAVAVYMIKKKILIEI